MIDSLGIPNLKITDSDDFLDNDSHLKVNGEESANIFLILSNRSLEFHNL